MQPTGIDDASSISLNFSFKKINYLLAGLFFIGLGASHAQ